jgi:hypothetical protein
MRSFDLDQSCAINGNIIAFMARYDFLEIFSHPKTSVVMLYFISYSKLVVFKQNLIFFI